MNSYTANSFVTFRKTQILDYYHHYPPIIILKRLLISFRSVDAIGPLQNKLTVHASADTYQRYTHTHIIITTIYMTFLHY